MTDTLTGRDLDARVEEVVMGHGVWWGTGHMPYLHHDSIMGPSQAVPHYSADTSEGWAAMRIVVERMKELGYELDVWEKPASHYRVTWYATNGTGRWTASADSFPEATARAALAALTQEATDAPH